MENRSQHKTVYLDNAATTPLWSSVQQAMAGAFQVYGNPSSLHRLGMEAERIVTDARKAVLGCLGVTTGQLVFTGCGTESNNLAVFGFARKFKERGRHIVTTAIEHPSVLEAMQALEREGWRVSYVKPLQDGSITAESVLREVTDDTVLVSVMHINNETGAILPISEIAKGLQNRHKVVLHVDGIQAFGKVPTPLKGLPIDSYSVSAHKIGGPKGVGALYIRAGLSPEPILYGGGQEAGLRSGTENVVGIAGFGAAAAHMSSTSVEHWAQAQSLFAQLASGLDSIPECVRVKPPLQSPYVVSASFPRLRGEVLLHALEAQGVFVSTGSACSTSRGQKKASHVLRAMAMPESLREGTLRFSLGPWTTEEDIAMTIDVLTTQVRWLRELER